MVDCGVGLVGGGFGVGVGEFGIYSEFVGVGGVGVIVVCVVVYG